MCKDCHEVKFIANGDKIFYNSFDELPQELKDKFKSKAKGANLQSSKKGFVRFINELNKRGDELIGDYIGATIKTLIKFGECGHTPSDGMKPNNYKNGQRCGLCKNKHTSQTKTEDLKGRRFGRLTVISLADKQTGGHAKWNCLCDCGNMTIANSGDLKSEQKQSCGCLHHELTIKRNTSERMRELSRIAWAKDDGTRRQQITQLGLNSKGENNPMYGRTGELSSAWKGGITPISYHLRNFTEQWDKDVRKAYDKKCALSGVKCTTKNSAVHHLYGFNIIVQDAHDKYNIQVKPQVKDYTEEELKLLEDYVVEWHKDTSNGVLLHNNVHKLFHRAKKDGGYGQGNNTPEQYEEFKIRYLNHEFDNELNN